MKERYEEINEERKKLTEDITKLTEEWYFLIGKDHHKDRDCHWYIETKWSYGYEPVYTVQHFGYVIHPDVEIEYSSYYEALRGLKELLTQHIAEEKRNQKEAEEND
jgi:hypothetical protein